MIRCTNSRDLSRERVLLTGGAGFLGSAVCRVLWDRGVTDESLRIPRRRECDLTVESDVERLFQAFSPTVVIHLAAEVGGIGANMAHPGRYAYANLAMGLHLVEASRRHGVAKFVHTGTVCAYPKHCPVPFREDDLWNGYPEETNAPYGVSKKALFVLLDGYHREYGLNSAVVVPVNLYGPGDNFDLATSHVIPALIRKFEEARIARRPSVSLWGTGSPTREFLHVDDAAEGIVRAAEIVDDPAPINLGSGDEITIRSLAAMIAAECGYAGDILWDETRPDGQPRRCLDITRAKTLLGWSPTTDFRAGISQTVAWWRMNGSSAAGVSL